MSKKRKMLLFLVFVLVLFLIPNIVQAKSVEATETTKTSTGVVVKWEYELDSNNDIVTLMCANKSDISGSLTIPSTIDGYTVKKLGKVGYDHTNSYYGKGTFEKAYGLQSVTIPNTVTEIGNNAFNQCTGLKQISIPDNVKSIGSYVFDGCTGVSNLTLGSSVTSIGSYAFRQCSGIKKLTIPDSVTTVGECAFYGCTGISSLTLSNNMTTIKEETFYGCSALTTVVLPNSITTLNSKYNWGYGAFENCKKLSKILIPDSVVTIDPYVFKNCDNLTIYGNDGQASKTYAEEYEINFDYIANWDKESSGTDITAPKVESMKITYSSVLNYWDSTTNTHRIPTGGRIQIIVAFSEEIKGTVPTLKIKCGEGQTREITNGTISGKNIVYDYTIQSGDEGVIASVSYEGGNITDNAGNKAELSCATLYVQYGTNEYAYANGTVADVKKDEGTEQPADDSGDGVKADDSDKGTQQSPSTDETKDTTKGETQDETIKKDSKLPQTGMTILSLFAVALMLVALISKMKCLKYKDI